MNKVRIIQFVLFIFISFGIIFVNEDRVFGGYPCPTGSYCVNGPTCTIMLYGYRPGDCMDTVWCNSCSGTDSNCSGELNVYSSWELCMAGGDTDLHVACCNTPDEPICTDDTDDCGPGCGSYSTTNLSQGSLTRTCTDDCGYVDSDTCYCSACTPLACPAQYSTTDQSHGSLVYDTCTNTCDVPTNRTCYCPEACTPPLCPSPLSATETTSSPDPNMILDDLMTCSNDCSVPQYRDCWETPSDQPTESLVIRENDPYDEDDPNYYGFSSTTHSGIPDLNVNTGNLNDPINMVATYSDPDGAGTIEGIFVWFRDVGLGIGEPNTPVLISTTTGAAKAPDIASWGFMMRKEGTNWVPYIPNYIPSPNNEWKKTSFTLGDTFYIKGPDGNNMVRVKRNNISTSGLTDVVMDFSLGFSGDDISTKVKETKYNILLMGLDEFSFTPYDNYPFYSTLARWDNYWKPNQLRYRESPLVAQTYAKDWDYTLKTWTVDKILPEIKFDNETPYETGNSIKIDWLANDRTDGKGIYAVVGNIYLTAEKLEEREEIKLSTSTPNVQIKEGYYVPRSSKEQDPGRLNEGWDFKIENIGGSTSTGSITVDIGANRTDDIEFYLTAFDNAGNMINPTDGSKLFNLNDWFVTDGGLAYSQGGTSFVTKEIVDETDLWANILPPFVMENESLLYDRADYSSEMWAQGDSVLAPSTLLFSHITDSFNINNFRFAEVDGYYDTLLKAYEENKSRILDLTPKEFSNTDEIILKQNDLETNSYCWNKTSYCVLKFQGNLKITALNQNQGFICDTKALIFVGGDLTISPPVYNDSLATDGCIFVVKGKVKIEEGEDATDTDFAYDQINAFILSDGKITIGHELLKVEEEQISEVIDDADDVFNWEPASGTSIFDEKIDKIQGERSIKVETSDVFDYTTLDLMEYPTDTDARAAYVASTFTASGGTKYTSGGYNYHKFTSDGTFTVPNGINVEALVVGGGGGGSPCTPASYSQGGAGGGGAGGVISGSIYVGSSKTVDIGLGGACGTAGQNSVFSTLIGIGGGAGSGHTGGSGGSGGGGGNGYLGGTGLLGKNGGTSVCSICGNATAGGGGGGMSGIGGNSRDYYGGNGGSGTNAYTTWLTATSSGEDVGGIRYIAGGGAGAGWFEGGNGGNGGGGNGADNDPELATVGTNGTGGGGGAGVEAGDAGKRGGSGLILVRYPNTAIQVYSEASIKQQGSYALKVFAPKDISLNQTIIKTFATPIRLENYSGISFQLRSTRVGSNIKIGFKDQGGVITEITPNITVENGYKEYVLDLTSVSNVNKDAISQIIITILNATADNTFYIDNVRGMVSRSQNDTIELKTYRLGTGRDMSPYDKIIFYVKSTIAGQTMRFQFGENNSFEQTKDITITNANEWQVVDWGIGAINPNSRNQVKYFAFYITNALNPFTFYFDYIINGGAPPPDPEDAEEIDGVYINGGLMSSSLESPSIDIMRYLRLEERLAFPVLAIDSHPKYGELARTFFGSNFRMQKTEVGFKPY